MLAKPVPAHPINWVAIDARKPDFHVVVCQRLFFDARDDAARRLRVATEHVRVQAVGEGASVESVHDYLRQRVAAERQQVEGLQGQAGATGRGRRVSA